MKDINLADATKLANDLGLSVTKVKKENGVRFCFVGNTRIYHNGVGGKACWMRDGDDKYSDYIGNMIRAVATNTVMR